MTQNTIFPPEVSHIHNGGDFHIILKRLYECIARKIILKQLFFSGLLIIKEYSRPHEYSSIIRFPFGD